MKLDRVTILAMYLLLVCELAIGMTLPFISFHASELTPRELDDLLIDRAYDPCSDAYASWLCDGDASQCGDMMRTGELPEGVSRILVTHPDHCYSIGDSIMQGADDGVTQPSDPSVKETR